MSDDFKEMTPKESVSQPKPWEEKPKEESVSSGRRKIFDPESLSGLVVILFVITAVTALLLGVVNAATEGRISEHQRRAAADAMQAVLPADSYEPVPDTQLYRAMKDGKLIGFASQTAPAGYGGPIVMMVGVDLKLEVTGVSIISFSETPGLGTKAKSEPSFLQQFIGKSSSAQLGTDIDAISGSTITSQAVTEGVREAVLNVARLQNEMSGGAS